nr:membrane protein [Mycolicibacterium malmesburyense]
MIGIVVLSVLPMFIEWYKRRRAAKRAGIATPPLEPGEQPG